jgi:serine/threonine-protein kinase
MSDDKINVEHDSNLGNYQLKVVVNDEGLDSHRGRAKIGQKVAKPWHTVAETTVSALSGDHLAILSEQMASLYASGAADFAETGNTPNLAGWQLEKKDRASAKFMKERAVTRVVAVDPNDPSYEVVLATHAPEMNAGDTIDIPMCRPVNAPQGAMPKGGRKSKKGKAPPSEVMVVEVIELAYVPAGEYLAGEEKKPTYVDSFFAALDPVTVGQFRHFVEMTGYNAGGNWKQPGFPQNDRHPVVCVSHYDSMAFARSVGLSLPLPDHWQKAARGTDGRDYPWGNDLPSGPEGNEYLHWSGSGVQQTGTCEVGKHPKGNSPYGLHDCAGNVWEWCADPEDYSLLYDEPFRRIVHVE